MLSCDHCRAVADIATSSWKVMSDAAGDSILCPECAEPIKKAASLMAEGKTKAAASIIAAEATRVRLLRIEAKKKA